MIDTALPLSCMSKRILDLGRRSSGSEEPGGESK